MPESRAFSIADRRTGSSQASKPGELRATLIKGSR